MLALLKLTRCFAPSRTITRDRQGPVVMQTGQTADLLWRILATKLAGSGCRPPCAREIYLG
jgi:hypothetical protein